MNSTLETSRHLQREATEATEATSLLTKDHYQKLKVYPSRWLALGVFISHMISNNAIWITFSPITTITQCYYNISLFWVNSLSWVYFITYIILIFPAVWYLENYGLKWTAILGGSLNAAGAWLRFAGSGHGMFWVLFAGQTLTSATYLVENNGCSKLSALWFPSQERALATALYSIISSQTGVLVALLTGPLVVTGGYQTDYVCNKTDLASEESYNEWQHTTYEQFFYYLLAQAILATVILPLTYVMPEAPPTPPSITAHTETKSNLKESLKEAFTNKYFVLFLLVSGIFTASSAAFVTVFQEVLHSAGYQKDQSYIGYLGVSMTLASIIGLLAIGKWIDYSKSGTAVTVGFVSTLTTLGLSLTVQFEVPFYYVFILATLTSCMLSLIGAVAFEYAVEMTYPLPESVSAGLLNITVQISGLLMVIVVGLLVEHKLAIYGNYIFCGAIFVSSVLMTFVRPTLRRVEIETVKIKI